MKHDLRKILLQTIIFISYSFMLNASEPEPEPKIQVEKLAHVEKKKTPFIEQKKLFRDYQEEARSRIPETQVDLINLYDTKCHLADLYRNSIGVKKSKEDSSRKKALKLYNQVLDSIERTETLLFCKKIINNEEDIRSNIFLLNERINKLNLNNELISGLEKDISNSLILIKNIDNETKIEDLIFFIDTINKINIIEDPREENIKLSVQKLIDSWEENKSSSKSFNTAKKTNVHKKPTSRTKRKEKWQKPLEYEDD